MLEIKDITGHTRLSVPINIGAKGKFTLMKEDYIVLPFSLPSPIAFRIGDWVDLTGVLDESLGGMLSKRYEITEIQKPTYNDNTGGYDYKLKLNAYYWKWKNKIFKYTPEHAGSEASWSLTATLDVQLGVFLRNLKALGYLFNGQEFTFEIDSSVENKAVPMVYDNMNLLDALFSMASKDKWNCDCWVTDNVIHFGRNEYGDSVKLELGVEASAMTHSESKGTYATRIYAFGSTRNIPANYRPASEQAVVNGVVQKRLMLPVDTPYIDAYEGMSQEEAIEDIVVFDDVYPRRVGTLSNVKTVDRKVDNPGEGEPSTFKAYQYKDAGLIFKKEYILEEQELEVTFQSGKLNGMKFGVVFEPEGASKQTWEIVANEDYGRLLPDETIYPANGDKYVLTGFNIQLVSDQYIPSAEKELKEKAIKYAGQRKRDDGTYNTTLNSVWVYEDKLKRFFEFGQKVNLVNKAFFETGRESRILGWELNLDIPWDSPSYVIGESMPYSRIGEIEGEVESLTYKGQAYAGGGNGVYLIKTNDRTAPSNSNAFSAKRTLISFLNKDRPDQTDFLQKFLGGLISTYIQSPEFLSGVMGHGFTLKQNEDGTTYAEVDKLMVRMKAIFQSLEIMKTELAGASFMFNASGARMTIVRTERFDHQPAEFADGSEAVFSDGSRAVFAGDGDFDSFTRCWFVADDGETAIENRFRVGNLVRSQTFNIKAGVHEGVSNRFWWREVIGVGDDYIDIAIARCAEGSDLPAEGDVCVQLGDLNDIDYQSAIVLSAYGEGAPYLTMYQSINSYSLADRDVFSIGYDKMKKECYVRNYGRMYMGDRNRNRYFDFDGNRFVVAADEIRLGGRKVEDIIIDETRTTEKIIDATALDENKYYPITFNLWTGSPKVRISLVRTLNRSFGVPSYASHGDGFDVRCVWTTNADGWGTAETQRNIEYYSLRWVKPSEIVVGDIGQMSHSSNEYIYVRGGSKYKVIVEGELNTGIILHTDTYTVNEQTLHVRNQIENVPIPSLEEAGIDIYNHTVKVTADNFYVNSTSGTPIAVFTTNKDGKPVLKAEHIDVDNLKVKHLDGADGTFSGIMQAKTIRTQQSTIGVDIGLNDTINPQVHASVIFGDNNAMGASGNRIKLPPGKDWVGLQITFIFIHNSRTSRWLELYTSDNFLYKFIIRANYCKTPANKAVTFTCIKLNSSFFWVPNSSGCSFSLDGNTWDSGENGPF